MQEPMKLDDFLMNLDGKKKVESDMLRFLFRFPESHVRESGKPVHVEAYIREDIVFEDGAWARDRFAEVLVYVNLHGKYMIYYYCDKPIYNTGKSDEAGYPIFTHFQESECKDRENMDWKRKFQFPFHVACSELATSFNYGVGNAKWLIDNTVALWFRPVVEEETA